MQKNKKKQKQSKHKSNQTKQKNKTIKNKIKKEASQKTKQNKRTALKLNQTKGVFTPGKSDSSLALVRTKGKKLYIVAIFSRFGSFSHHSVCYGPNQLKRTKMQSRDNIRFTCWLDVNLYCDSTNYMSKCESTLQQTKSMTNCSFLIPKMRILF